MELVCAVQGFGWWLYSFYYPNLELISEIVACEDAKSPRTFVKLSMSTDGSGEAMVGVQGALIATQSTPYDFLSESDFHFLFKSSQES